MARENEVINGLIFVRPLRLAAKRTEGGGNSQDGKGKRVIRLNGLELCLNRAIADT